MGAKLVHTFYVLPEHKISNELLEKQFPETTADEIFKKTGIKNRFVLNKNEISSDLAVKAANQFFSFFQIQKNEIDFLIFCSEGFDYIAGVTSAILQNKIGLKNEIGVLDMPQGCTGYIYGLAMAKSLIAGKIAKSVLLITSDMASNVLHPNDLELRSLFGDAASVSLIQSDNDNKIGEFVFGTDGSGHEYLFVERSASRNPPDAEWFKEHEKVGGMPIGRMKMNSLEIFRFSLRELPGLINQTLTKNNLNFEEVDLFIFHQANGFMLERIRKKLGIPNHKFYVYMENTGNTVSSSIPICITEAQKEGKILPGTKVMVIGFGIGLCWGATIIKF